MIVPSEPPSNIKTPLVLGPLVIGTFLNTGIYGICVAQFSNYWDSKFKDHVIIRSLVWWTFFLDTFHTASLMYMLWVYVVVEFENVSFLQHVLWPFSTTPAVTTLTSFPIQIYLSWRIRLLSQSLRVFAVLAVMSGIQASLGIACSIAAFKLPNIGIYSKLIPFVDTWQAFAVLADGSITALLVWYLIKKRTGGKQSNGVIARVIRLSAETAAVGAFFCIMDLFSFTALQGSNIHVIFAFPLGRIYTNTLLLTLNSRSALREELQRPIIPDILIPGSTVANYDVTRENDHTRSQSRGRHNPAAILGNGNGNVNGASLAKTQTIESPSSSHEANSIATSHEDKAKSTILQSGGEKTREEGDRDAATSTWDSESV